ncbi:MAG: cytochrome P450 [Acidimicrobiales bacterium]|nr:cytochrome P450 [Acidimicrobiales bacterium]
MDAASNPQPYFRMLRDSGPVLPSDAERPTIVSRHADVLSVLRTPEVFSSNADAAFIGQVRPLIPLQIDPPEHSKYRKLLDPLFAPKRIAELEPATRALVAELIDSVADRGHANFHAEVAEPFPSTVFLQLLGLPVSRAAEFVELKDGIIRPRARTLAQRNRMVAETGQRIYAVLEAVIDERMAERRDDFISGFLDMEVDGERLTRDDVVDICYLFFLAGLDTVTASLDCFLAYLAQHRDHCAALVADPSLIPGAVEELLRWETPVTGVIRITTTDTEVAGCPIPAGTQVSPLLGSADTDERFWDDPDEVRFDRPVNKHVAFGAGVHRCLGSHLARMELRVALEEWHRRIPHYRLADGCVLDYSQGLRQIENLELVW